MIDFHCHVLMGIDDGSRNLESSVSMLEASKTQGVQRIVCTPHFDATKDRMEEFLINRDHAFQILQKWIDVSDAVDIRLYPAAEVFFLGLHFFLGDGFFARGIDRNLIRVKK